jgi:hypothetical protein
MKKPIRMTVVVERPYYGGDYIAIRAEPVYIENGETRYFSDSWGDPNRGLYKLTVAAQANLRDDSEPYGWDKGAVYRDIHEVSLVQAEQMIKTLRKIDRSLNKIKDELGYASSYGQQLARVGKILGVTSYGFEPTNGEATWATDERWQWVQANMIDSYVGSHLTRLRKAAGVIV